MSLTHQTNSAARNALRGKKSLLYDSEIVLSGHAGAVYASQFSPNGQCIASGGHDRNILLWHLPTNPEESQPNHGVFLGHKGAVTSLRWVHDSSIFSTSADSTISFWDAETGQRTRKASGHSLVVNDCSVYANGVCVSVGDDGALRMWDEREKHEVMKIETEFPLLCCDVSKDGTVYFSGIDPTIQAFDLRKKEQLWKCPGIIDSVTSLSLSSDGTMLAAKAMDGLVRTLSAKSSLPPGVQRMGSHTYTGAVGSLDQYLTRVSFNSDNMFIGLASGDSSLIMWGSASRRMVHKLLGHEGCAIDVDFHPTQKIVMSSDAKGYVIVREY